MDKKVLISITGTTCAGKSTLLKAIQEATQDVYIMPQITTRQARSDDDPKLMKYAQTLNKDEMFVYNKELSYGISKQDIREFLASDKHFAVAVNGSDEIEMLKFKSAAPLQYKNILLTFTGDSDSEIKTLSEQLKHLFNEENYNKRMAFYSGHIKNKLLNQEFINGNIDLHLTREMSVSAWSVAVAKMLEMNPHNLYVYLNKEVQQQPKIKKYVNPEVAMGLSNIILSLQRSKRQTLSNN